MAIIFQCYLFIFLGFNEKPCNYLVQAFLFYVIFHVTQNQWVLECAMYSFR